MPSIYKLTKPLLMMRHHRIDSFVDNCPHAYKSDSEFFKRSSQRKNLIRAAFVDEFDINMPLSEWLQVPRLWCYVTQISIGKHSVVPIYRGKQFWSEINDDSAVASVLEEMQRREGIDLPEWKAFAELVNAKYQKALADIATEGPVN